MIKCSTAPYRSARSLSLTYSSRSIPSVFLFCFCFRDPRWGERCRQCLHCKAPTSISNSGRNQSYFFSCHIYILCLASDILLKRDRRTLSNIRINCLHNLLQITFYSIKLFKYIRYYGGRHYYLATYAFLKHSSAILFSKASWSFLL